MPNSSENPATINKLQALLEAKSRHLEATHEASRTLLSLLGHVRDETTLMQKGIEALSTLIQARYGAVSILAENGGLERFIHTGIDRALEQRIGSPPTDKGLLGIIVRENQVLRLDTMQDDPRASGFPQHHPKMTTMLAAPISTGRRTYGRVYLCDKFNGQPFNDDDQQFVTTFANTLAIMLLNLQATRRRHKAEEELHLAAKVIDHTHEGVMITDRDNIIRSVNPAFTTITGYAKHEVLGKNPRILRSKHHDNNDALFSKLWSSLNQEGYWEGELWSQRKNGETYPQWTMINAVRDHKGEITQYASVFSDITKRKKQEKWLQHLAHHDPLTQLPNRTLIEDRLKQTLISARRYHQKLALMFLDLDLFKNVNDTLGHTAGDRLLQSVAKRLQTCVRECDTVGRIGGDEFTVILCNMNSTKDAALVAQKILDTLGLPFNLDGHEVHISASIGIALFPNNGQDFETLIKCADTAMYQSKESGNNYAYYTDPMGSEASINLLREEALFHAMERNELSVHYQPKLDIQTLKVIGVKALLRWHNPQLGPVSPCDFIPLAEQTGLIIPIGNWALQQACTQCATWSRDGLPTISITAPLSARQFFHDNLLETISCTLAESTIHSSCLWLEITKKTALKNLEQSAQRLSDLKALGVRVIVENSGDAAELLGSHNPISADALKLNSASIQNIMSLRSEPLAQEEIIKGAHDLKIRIIAEGVENMEQLRFLRSHQCDEILGNFFSRPISAAELEQILKNEVSH